MTSTTMKKIFLASIIALSTLNIFAQEIHQDSVNLTNKGDRPVAQAFQKAADALVSWDTETMIDSLDQEKLPRLVSGGLFAGANMSNFVITRDRQTMSSYMKVGAELGGFIDFALSKHFAIQPQVIFTAQENYFAVTDTANHLWSFGMEIPVYFLGRFGNMQQGYVQFGGGIFTHFTFASNIANKYRSFDEIPGPGTHKTDGYDYSRLYSLHNNHFGLCAMVGYEFWFGLQINASYKISLSDVAGFYSEMKGQKIADALIFPQSVSLTVGYRWK